MTVSPCPGCMALVYTLRDEEGRALTVDTCDSATGIWWPQPDGRTVRRLTLHELTARRIRGHARHECPPGAVPQQPSLFEISQP